MFGSSVHSQTFITLKISRAQKIRNLNRTWYFPKQQMIEVALSPNQFSELLTTMNMGSGVPCTIDWVNGEGGIESPPVENERQILNEEFQQEMDSLTSAMRQYRKRVKEILEKKSFITKSDKTEIISMMNTLISEINSTIPFVRKSFDESVDKTIVEAKSEMESFWTTAVMNLGHKAIVDGRMGEYRPKLVYEIDENSSVDEEG